MPSTDRLVIAIDFGTTFTGVAAAYSKTPERVEIINTWPGGGILTSDKVPTQFTYNVEPRTTNQAPVSDDVHRLIRVSTKQELKSRKDIRWGYEVQENEDKILYVKLFLDVGKKLPSFLPYRNISAELQLNSRNVEAAVADFLAKIREHTVETLTLRWSAAFMRTTKIEYVLTVPAIWSDKAKHSTLQAAKQAGLTGKIKMISEPEAAAIHTLAAVQPNYLHVGHNVVVCDAGGGTVDLISYKITQVKPLQVVESVQGEGGLCGGAFLNLRFEEHVKARIGEERFNRFKSGKHWRKAQIYFEEKVKRSFGATYMTEFQVPVTGLIDDEAAGIEDSELILTTEQVKDIFDPLIHDIITLIDHQVQALRKDSEEVAAIICVGGFGQSAYLQQRLKAHFHTDVPPAYSVTPASDCANASVKDAENKAIDIMVSTDCWTACVRGALQRGLQDSIVTARKCRFHYGVEFNPQFHEEVHPESSKYWDEHDEIHRATGVMDWYMKKGETVGNEREIKLSFYRTWANDPLAGCNVITSELLASGDSTQAVMRTDDQVFKVCTLTTDLSSVPRRHFRPCTNKSGMKHYKLSYELVMTINSADIEFALEVDGESHGTVTASFDHSESYEIQ